MNIIPLEKKTYLKVLDFFLFDYTQNLQNIYKKKVLLWKTLLFTESVKKKNSFKKNQIVGQSFAWSMKRMIKQKKSDEFLIF